MDLIPNGSNIPVTRENRLQYIYLVAHFRLTKQIKKQSAAFFEGLSEIIDPKWLRCVSRLLRRWRSTQCGWGVGCSTSRSCRSCWAV